ncbi:MAG: glycosyltransferase family 2 protein [Sedimentisphaerales bacterium]|nr:glycosyltransferase family 2 protein [Sedimentisphaerales bacterium]
MQALDYPADRIEFLYLYESASTDRTEEVIQSFARNDPRIKPICRATSKGGKAPITNDGIRQAKGQIIGIFDADHALNPDLVRLAVAQLQDPKVGCVRGRCRIRNATQNLVTRLVAMERDMVERLGIYGAYRIGGFSNFGGGHGFFRREVFEKVGLFDEDILTEDIDFSVRLHQAGYEIKVLPQMQSWEEAPFSMRSLLAQRKRWSRGWMQVWRKQARAVLRCRPMSRFKKLDIGISLFSSVASALIMAVVPLIILGLAGARTSWFGPRVSLWLWMYVTMSPVSLAWIACILDQDEDNPPGLGRYFLLPLLIPYILFLIFIGWLGFVDEFVLHRPYSYIKTGRAEETFKEPVLTEYIHSIPLK